MERWYPSVQVAGIFDYSKHSGLLQLLREIVKSEVSVISLR